MRELPALFADIETHEFAARLNVASNFKTFLRAADLEAAVHELAARLRSSEADQAAVAGRCRQLVTQDVDEDFSHPHDTAIAVYCLLLDNVGSPHTRSTVADIRSGKNLWWAQKIAEAAHPSDGSRSDADAKDGFASSRGQAALSSRRKAAGG